MYHDKLLHLGCIYILLFRCSQRFIIKDKGSSYLRPGISWAGTSLDLQTVALSSVLESQSLDYILCEDCLGSETAWGGGEKRLDYMRKEKRLRQPSLTRGDSVTTAHAINQVHWSLHSMD